MAVLSVIRSKESRKIGAPDTSMDDRRIPAKILRSSFQSCANRRVRKLIIKIKFMGISYGFKYKRILIQIFRYLRFILISKVQMLLSHTVNLVLLIGDHNFTSRIQKQHST